MEASLTTNRFISFSSNTFSYLNAFSFVSFFYCLLLFFLGLAIGGQLCGGLAILNNSYYKFENRYSFHLVDSPHVVHSTLHPLNRRVIIRYNNSYVLTTPSNRLKLLHAPPWDLLLPLHLPPPTIPPPHAYLLPPSCLKLLLRVIHYGLSSFSNSRTITDDSLFPHDPPSSSWGSTLSSTTSSSFVDSLHIDLFCESFDPCQYFQLLSQLSICITSSSSASTSSALNTRADALILEHGGTPGCLRINLSAQDTEQPIVIDSGASFSVSSLIDDFDFPHYIKMHSKCNQLDGSTDVLGRGPVSWSVPNTSASTTTLRPIARHIPSAQIRLFSPQDYFLQVDGGSLFLDKDGCTLQLPDGDKISVSFNPHNNLPMLSPVVASDSLFSFNTITQSSINESIASESNQNITSNQKELLVWHWRLGHIGMNWLQSLMKQRTFVDMTGGNKTVNKAIISTKHSTTSKCAQPKCAGCLLGKAQCKNIHKSKPHLREKFLSIGKLQPGDLIFVDQYVSKTKGRLLNTRGKESEHEMYNGGTIFVDAATSFTKVFHQTSLRAGDTLRSKHAFDRIAREHGITIKKYHGDNGIFQSSNWISVICSIAEE